MWFVQIKVMFRQHILKLNFRCGLNFINLYIIIIQALDVNPPFSENLRISVSSDINIRLLIAGKHSRIFHLTKIILG